MTNRSDSLIFTENLIKYINDSPSAYHSVENALSILESAGFTKLDSCERFLLLPAENIISPAEAPLLSL